MAKDREYFRRDLEHGEWEKVKINPHSPQIVRLRDFPSGSAYNDGYNEYKWEPKEDG